MEIRRDSNFVIVTFVCGLLFCSPGAAQINRLAGSTEPKMAEKVLKCGDQGLASDVTVGETVLLQLAETPSTGYRWSIEASPRDTIEIIESRWIAPDGGGVGAEGKREFRIRIKAPGEIRLGLKLWREWQGEGSVTQHCEIILRVH